MASSIQSVAVPPALRVPSDGSRRTVLQGDCVVTHDAAVVLTTVLGSCVACCLYDPHVKVGGMNHFLLPGAQDGAARDAERYGVHAMELLVNAMLQAGATRSGLRAHLYGGAAFTAGAQPIGAANARFATDFLLRDRIALARHDLGGGVARRVDFQAALGRVRCRSVGEAPREAVPAPVPAGGDVELF